VLFLQVTLALPHENEKVKEITSYKRKALLRGLGVLVRTRGRKFHCYGTANRKKGFTAHALCSTENFMFPNLFHGTQNDKIQFRVKAF
jgi:hypothetical protein